MRVAQLVPAMLEYDAIGNFVLLIDDIFVEFKIHSRVFASFIQSEKFIERVQPLDSLSAFHPDLIIYHLGIGDSLGEYVQCLGVPYIIYYHNITPPVFYRDNWPLASLLEWGRRQLTALADNALLGLAASYYSQKEMNDVGYRGKSVVIPIFIHHQKIERISIDWRKFEDLKNGQVNICSVGRLVRHKKQDDVIRIFHAYKDINKHSKLFLLGSSYDINFLNALMDLIQLMNLKEDVKILTSADDETWKAHLQSSHVFVSASEHEGFCVPIIEANYFNLPIVAYSAGAIPEVLGESGILINSKDNLYDYATAINRVVTDDKYRMTLISNAKTNLSRFSKEFWAQEFIRLITTLNREK